MVGAYELQHEWQDHHARDRHDNEHDACEGEQEGSSVEANEAALLLLAVDDVQRVKEGRDSRVGAYQGDD